MATTPRAPARRRLRPSVRARLELWSGPRQPPRAFRQEAETTTFTKYTQAPNTHIFTTTGKVTPCRAG